jgi:hypothetical protein
VTNKIKNRLLDVWSTVPWLTSAARTQHSSEQTAAGIAAGAMPDAGKQEAKPQRAAPDERSDGGN